MSLLALHHHPDRWELGRYGAAAIAIVLAHAAIIAAAMLWYERPEPEGVSIPAILIDLAPAPAAPHIQTQDVAPGPEAEEAEPAPPEPQRQEMVEEQLAPMPLQPDPVVAAPPEVLPKPRPEPEPAKPEPVHREVKKATKKPPAPRTTAAPKAERIGRETPASSSGASAAAAASYRSILAAHLQRFKQYPSSARARGEEGSAAISFTVTRNGRVTSSRLVRSSGFASLDHETLAIIQRAQPLPAFPPEMRQPTMNYTVPFRFETR